MPLSAARLVAFICLTVLVCPAALGQTATAPAAEEPPPPVRYAEPSFGFSIELPGDWTYDRTRFTAPGDGLGLCRGRSLVQRASLQFVLYRGPGVASFEKQMERFKADLLRVPDTALAGEQKRELAGFPVIELELDVAGGGERYKSLHLAIELEPGTVLMFVYSGVLAAEGDAQAPRRQFEALLGSLEIQYSQARRRELDAAMARGRQVVVRVRDAAEQREWREPALFFEILENGRPAGYLSRRVTREQRSLDDPGAGGNVKPGIRIHERSWKFGPDDSALEYRGDYFASFDQRSELMETATTPIPSQSAPLPRIVTTTEQVIREEELLFASTRTSLDLKFPEPREPVRTGPTYLSAVWMRLLPTLLDPAATDTYAFSVYDPATGALLTHVIRPAGRRPLPDGGGKQARAFELSEAYSPAPSLVYVDEAGDPLRIEAGPLALVRVSEKEAEQRYGPQREKARKRAAALQPQPAPAPATPPRPPRGRR